MSQLEMANIIEHVEVCHNHYKMVLHSPKIAEIAKPGQFVHVKINETLSPILRRPISLHGINKEEGTITLLYHVIGEGTKLLAQKPQGDKLDIMGPIGNGFNIPEGVKSVALIGGGIGVAPLFPLVEELRKRKIEVRVYYGCRGKDYVIKTNNLM
jgi:dihydroorotate dehydrogenase electron transfer subunit